MSAATSPDDRILVVPAPIRSRLLDLVTKEAGRVERSAGLARKYGAPAAVALENSAAELRRLAEELAR